MAKPCSLLWTFAEPPSEPSSLCQTTDLLPVCIPEYHLQTCINTLFPPFCIKICVINTKNAIEPAGEQQCNSLVEVCTFCSLYVYVGRLTSLCKHEVSLLDTLF